jgi:hypothetical protein
LHCARSLPQEETCAREWRRRRWQQQITACLHQNVKKSLSRATTKEFSSAASGKSRHCFFFSRPACNTKHRGKKKPSPGQQILLHTQIRSRSRAASQAMQTSTSQTTFQYHPHFNSLLYALQSCMLSQ